MKFGSKLEEKRGVVGERVAVAEVHRAVERQQRVQLELAQRSPARMLHPVGVAIAGAAKGIQELRQLGHPELQVPDALLPTPVLADGFKDPPGTVERQRPGLYGFRHLACHRQRRDAQPGIGQARPVVLVDRHVAVAPLPRLGGGLEAELPQLAPHLGSRLFGQLVVEPVVHLRHQPGEGGTADIHRSAELDALFLQPRIARQQGFQSGKGGLSPFLFAREQVRQSVHAHPPPCRASPTFTGPGTSDVRAELAKVTRPPHDCRPELRDPRVLQLLAQPR